jgi:hypothetical protein
MFNNEKIKELELRIKKLEFQLNNPKPYNKGDKYGKECVVTSCDVYHIYKKIASEIIHDKLFWRVTYTNKITGFTGSDLI